MILVYSTLRSILKMMIKYCSLAIILFFAFFSIENSHALDKQVKEQKKDKPKKEKAEAKATIKTSAQCNMCKKTIEQKVMQVKGVSKATLAIGTAELKVRYNSKETNLDNIRKVIAASGYDADQVKADQAAYNNLPACCKAGGHK